MGDTMAISISPNEQGTAIVTFTFEDEEGNPVVMKTSAWQLMKVDGTIVNNRSFANCSFTGDTVILSGDDLAIFEGIDTGVRIIAFKGTYDSTVGNDLPLTFEDRFSIKKLVSQVDKS